MSCSLCRTLYRFAFHIESVWLFTYSDLKTIVFTSSSFGILNGIAVSLENRQTLSPSIELPDPSKILLRGPLVLFWIWINLLPFNIDNQRQPQAIQEDSLNKPWRTMPSRRLSKRAVKYLMLVLYLTAVLVSFVLGTLKQCIALILLGYWYNDLGGADGNPLTRNFINACGFVCFASGALQVAISQNIQDAQYAQSTLQIYWRWFLVMAAIIFSTVQTQDMYDQRGDAARDRKTLPLLIGDTPARWVIAASVAVWCCATPWLWGCPTVGYIVPGILGFSIIKRTLLKRDEREDKITFRVWNIWLVSIYLLPLIKALSAR